MARPRPLTFRSRGWKDILWRVYHNVPEHRIISIAAGVTFFALLAIFPALAALVAIYGLFADPGQSVGMLPIWQTSCLEGQLKSLVNS